MSPEHCRLLPVSAAAHKKVHVLLISLVVPNASALGGFLILQRYLEETKEVSYRVIGSPDAQKARVYKLLNRRPLRRVARILEHVWPPRPNSRDIDAIVREFKPDVILTVAHGWWALVAVAVAKRHRLPLISLFQDWWPDFDDVPDIIRPLIARQFRRICDASQTALCVSSGMHSELGAPANAIVLHDVPSAVQGDRLTPAPAHPPFRIVYFGNLQEYGPLVESAIRSVANSTNIRLEVFGPPPRWSRGAEAEFRAAGIYHGLVAPDRIHAEITTFHAGLVVMSFDPKLRRRMRTSFPSKLVEFAQFHRPIVIWGPDYCSAVQWAQEGDQAICVTDPNPAAFQRALERLASSPAEQQRLSLRSQRAAATEFNRPRILAEFSATLERATAQCR